MKLFSADRLLPRRASPRALGYSDTQIREMEAEDAEAYSRAVGDQTEDFGPKPLPVPRNPADDEPDESEFGRVPASRRRAPVQLGPSATVPPLAVQFREPALAGRSPP